MWAWLYREIYCFNCGASGLIINLDYDGSYISFFNWNIENNFDFVLTGSYLLSLAPGTHTIKLSASVSSFFSGASVTFGYLPPGFSTVANNMITQVIPQ